jgi:hypothetical protein
VVDVTLVDVVGVVVGTEDEVDVIVGVANM